MRAIPLNIPDDIKFNFIESEDGIYLCLEHNMYNNKAENIFYYNEEQSNIANKMKLYQVIQNMINKVTAAS